MNAHSGYDDFTGTVQAAFHPIHLLDVLSFPHLSRVFVIIEESDLVSAIGRRGEVVQRVSRTLALDVEVMTMEELNARLSDAPNVMARIDGLDKNSASALAKHGILDLEDLSTMDPTTVGEIAGLSLTDATAVVDAALDSMM